MRQFGILSLGVIIALAGCSKPQPVNEPGEPTRPGPATRPAPPSQPAKATRPGKKVVPAVPDKPLAESIRDLQDPSPEVRMQAAQAVAKHGAKAEAAVPALNDLLKDKETYVRRAAVELGRAAGRGR